MGKSNIEWCDYTFNHVRGCQKIAPGCKFCYAEKLVNGRMQGDFSRQRVRLSDAGWKEPVKWNRSALVEEQRNCGPLPRPRVFCASLADVFEDWSGPIVDHKGERIDVCKKCGDRMGEYWACATCGPQGNVHRSPVTMNDLRRDLFALIDATPNLDYLLLTKRPENVRRMWPATPGVSPQHPAETYDEAVGVPYRHNCWIGTSIATQADADKNIPELLKCRDLASVLFVSAEPLLGPLDLFGAWGDYIRSPQGDAGRLIDWAIVGGESGPNARPYNLEWPRSIIAQCKAAGVACFHKQVGSYPVDIDDPAEWQHGDRDFYRVRGIKDKKGGDISEWPEDLRIRQFPSTEASCHATCHSVSPPSKCATAPRR